MCADSNEIKTETGMIIFKCSYVFLIMQIRDKLELCKSCSILFIGHCVFVALLKLKRVAGLFQTYLAGLLAISLEN